jgi:hypothetical protein
MSQFNQYDVVIIGAGAAGMFCAAEAGRHGKSVLLIDHATKIGEKIRISGGGRCNFTNIHTNAENFLSQNPKFCLSALAGFSPQDFIDRVDAAGIKWHEKTLGQLFCDEKAGQIIDMLVEDCEQQRVVFSLGTIVEKIDNRGQGFRLQITDGGYLAQKLVIATGGKSIPKIGATGFGYDVARQFGIPVIETRPALVPLTFEGGIKEMSQALAGVSVEAVVSHGKTQFREGFLFTHRGLSGPSILQISSYWVEGDHIVVDLYPTGNLFEPLKEQRQKNGRIALQTALAEYLPKKLVQEVAVAEGWEHSTNNRLADWSDKKLQQVAARFHQWQVLPSGSEGYRTAEVTLGGVDTKALNSKSMEVKKVPGLYFIGEVVDVTGWLGGYNFQWAWASGYAAAQAIGSSA